MKSNEDFIKHIGGQFVKHGQRIAIIDTAVYTLVVVSLLILIF